MYLRFVNQLLSHTVTASFHEPIEGWVSNFTGANGVFAGIVGGVLRCLKLDEDAAIDMVFGDYVINGALAAAYEVSTVTNVNPPIYNIVSSNDYVTTFGEPLSYSINYK